MNRAYKFRIYQNREQRELIGKTFCCVRFVFNKMLGEKIEHYKQTEKSLKATPAKYKSEFGFLKEVDSLVLANEQLNLEKAYKNFFRDKNIGQLVKVDKWFPSSKTCSKCGAKKSCSH